MPQIVSPPQAQPPTQTPIITTCPHCQYTISYTEDEVERVDNDAMGIYCPQCGGAITTKHIEPFTFPDTFFYFGGENATKLNNDEIQKIINITKRELQQDLKTGEYTLISKGDTIVLGFKEEDEDEIFVIKNYWQESIIFKE